MRETIIIPFPVFLVMLVLAQIGLSLLVGKLIDRKKQPPAAPSPTQETK